MGLSPRGNLDNEHHGVVCYEGVMVHDPLGNMEGFYKNECLLHVVIIVKDPSKFINLKTNYSVSQNWQKPKKVDN